MDDPTRKLKTISQGLSLSDLKAAAGLSGLADLKAAAGLSGVSEIIRHANGAKSILERAGLPRSVPEVYAAAQGLDNSTLAATKALRDAYSGHTAATDISRALGNAHTSIAQMAQVAYGPLSDMKRLTLYNQELFESFRLRQQVIESFGIIHPDLSQVSQIAKTIAGIIKPHGEAFAQLDGWKRNLADRMGMISSAWVLADNLEFSGMAFGELTRLGSTIHFDAPFSEETDEYVIDELGQLVVMDDDADEETRETAYSEAGRNPDLVAFPQPAYGGVLVAAGFSLIIPEAPTPMAVANDDPSAEFDPSFWSALIHLEQHIRMFIKAQLFALDGAAWVRRRVPLNVRNEWKDRQDLDRSMNRPVYEPIQYAHFTELADIICETANWRDAFEPIFGYREGLRVSLMRLSPMRNGNAHARPRTRTDMLYFATEAHRLLRAIGVIGDDNCQ